jgi:hypothetical protein
MGGLRRTTNDLSQGYFETNSPEDFADRSEAIAEMRALGKDIGSGLRLRPQIARKEKKRIFEENGGIDLAPSTIKHLEGEAEDRGQSVPACALINAAVA